MSPFAFSAGSPLFLAVACHYPVGRPRLVRGRRASQHDPRRPGCRAIPPDLPKTAVEGRPVGPCLLAERGGTGRVRGEGAVVQEAAYRQPELVVHVSVDHPAPVQLGEIGLLPVVRLDEQPNVRLPQGIETIPCVVIYLLVPEPPPDLPVDLGPVGVEPDELGPGLQRPKDRIVRVPVVGDQADVRGRPEELGHPLLFQDLGLRAVVEPLVSVRLRQRLQVLPTEPLVHQVVGVVEDHGQVLACVKVGVEVESRLPPPDDEHVPALHGVAHPPALDKPRAPEDCEERDAPAGEGAEQILQSLVGLLDRCALGPMLAVPSHACLPNNVRQCDRLAPQCRGGSLLHGLRCPA